MSTQFPRRSQPGASLFGRAVAQHRRSQKHRSSSDSESADYLDGQDEMGGQDDEYYDDDDSDAGTIYSTAEAARRTPAQINKEREVQKQFLLTELIRMKRDGVQLSRDYTDKDPIELMSMEIDRYKTGKAEQTFVGMVKVGISMGFNGIEMFNKWKGKGWVPLDGWAKGMTSDMSIYDDSVRQAVRQQLARSGPIGNPLFTLAFIVVGSFIFHILVAKMSHSQNGSAMFVQMMKSGGVMGAIGGMGDMASGGGNTSQPSGASQPVPNMGNPFSNQNVPATPPLYTQAPAPQPTPQPVPQPAPQPAPQPQHRPPSRPRSQKKRKPMRRPSFMHPPPAQPVHTDNMGSESTLNLDE